MDHHLLDNKLLKTSDKETPNEAQVEHHDAGAAEHPVVSMQRTMGNASLQRMLQGSGTNPGSTFIQAKMSVTPADDKYEQEADAVAKQVVQQSKSPIAGAGDVQRAGEEDELAMKRIQRANAGVPEEEEINPKRIQRAEEDELAMKRIQRQEDEAPEDEAVSMKRIQRAGEEDELAMKRIQRAGEEDELAMKRIQREAAPEEDELAMKRIQRAGEEDELAMKRIQREAAPEEDELAMKRIQRSADSAGGFEVGGDIENAINSKRGSGQPLPSNVQRTMEGAMGADFSGVRVHNDSESDTLNQSVQARAFTVGSDVFFRSGEYKPESTEGQELLAHELTHTVQQGAAPRQ